MPAATPPPTISIGGLSGLAIYDLDGTRLRELTTAPAQLSLEIGEGRILYISKRLDGALELRELDADGDDRSLATLPQLFDPDSCQALIPHEAELEGDPEETQWLPSIEFSGDRGFGVDLRSGHACLHMRDREAEHRHELDWVSADRLWAAGVLWRTDEHSCIRLDGTLTRTIVPSGGD